MSWQGSHRSSPAPAPEGPITGGEETGASGSGFSMPAGYWQHYGLPAPPPALTRPSSIGAMGASASAPSSLGGGDAPGGSDEGEGRLLGGDPEPAGGKDDKGKDDKDKKAAKSISTADLSAAEWKDHGQFKWWINWVTDGTSGWIVQQITNTYSGKDAAGRAITNATVGAVPSYYEAWEVDKAGKITGSLGATGNRDRWERPSLGAKSKGAWSMTGKVYWTASDPAKSGFTSGGVSNAGSLLSSTSAPADLSAAPLTRTAKGEWDSTGAKPVHKGSAS